MGKVLALDLNVEVVDFVRKEIGWFGVDLNVEGEVVVFEEKVRWEEDMLVGEEEFGMV